MAQSDFQERLNRISQKAATADGPSDPSGGFSDPAPVMRRKRGGSPHLMGPIMFVGFLGFALSAFIVMSLTNHVTGFFGVMTGTHVLSVDGAPQKGGETPAIPKTGKLLPIQAFPPAPEGWVRMTQDDALGGNLLAKVTQDWPATGTPLEQNFGYKRLKSFAKIYATSDIETRMTANRKSSALYLSTEGNYINVGMVYRTKSKLLGDPSQPASWADTLEQEAGRKLKPKHIIERVELAGFTAINRTQPSGSSILKRPLGDNRDVSTVVDLRVPLTHRALISISGVASATELERLLALIDVDRLP